MGEKIYLILEDGGLRALEESPYETEAMLQQLLADYPDLLAGHQIDPESPRRWLFVSREQGIPAAEGGSGRWAVDHLFLDQDGVPTLVEVKRGTDTRIRREVVGQVLEYAANAVLYWPAEDLRRRFEERCRDAGSDPDEVLRQQHGGATEAEPYWAEVAANLRDGRVRLLFVADTLPEELKRIIEFLNGQMREAEVLGVEIKQFTGGAIRTLVPKVCGQTEAARGVKQSARSGRKWDEASFFEEMARRQGDAIAGVAQKIYEWSQTHADRVSFGSGKQSGSFVPTIVTSENKHDLFAVYTYGKLEMYFYWYKFKAAFPPERCRELRERLNRIPEVHLSEEDLSRRPVIPLSFLVPPESLHAFLAAMEWFIQPLRSPDQSS